MAALREIQSEYDVARLEEREVYSGVRLRARMWLHVGMIRGEELLHAGDRALLHHVHELASAVVALPRQTLRVLVGQRSSHCFEHRWRDEVLAGDQLKAMTLPVDLQVYESGNLGIGMREIARRHRDLGS